MSAWKPERRQRKEVGLRKQSAVARRPHPWSDSASHRRSHFFGLGGIFHMRSRWLTFSIALVVVLMVALPVAGFAQTSRIEGMAIQGDYVKDYTGIYTYPSCITAVGNLMYAELGTSPALNNLSTGTPVTADRAVGTVMDKLFD